MLEQCERKKERNSLSKSSSFSSFGFDSKGRLVPVFEHRSSHEFHCNSDTADSFDMLDVIVTTLSITSAHIKSVLTTPSVSSKLSVSQICFFAGSSRVGNARERIA